MRLEDVGEDRRVTYEEIHDAVEVATEDEVGCIRLEADEPPVTGDRGLVAAVVPFRSGTGHRDPLLSRPAFHRRLLVHFLVALGFIAGSLGLGMAGYAWFEHLSWLDAFLNAAMILGGMGPVDLLRTPGGKLFAGLYALYSGLAFLVTAGILFAPILDRLMHRFHWDTKNS